MSMYRIVHKESGKECIVEVDKYDNAEIKRKASKQMGIKICPTEMGHIRILPL
ncbi:MAG: hypothetical protein Unbinned15contig1001_25 [Prokaryotic dsDNA virus sp.]|nr:MAG: hypothetical protein Unbinned15contig1001_25 [Prokaryotic dsDNA virus sp.]|tara:strand:- start:7661 stop:7819 length:159 start_codon:yes stop_codon:yes gene_type:complete